VVHPPVSRGLAVFADAWLSGWLAEISADLRENGSALEVVSRRCAIHDFTYFTLEGSDCSNRISSANFLIEFHSNYGSILLSFQDMTMGQTTDRQKDRNLNLQQMHTGP